MRRTTTTTAVAIAAAALAAAVLGVPSVAGASDDRPYSGTVEMIDDLRAVALTDGGTRLLRFDVDRPNRARVTRTISGLATDTFLIGIDYRVQDGMLYGVGNAGGLYTLDPRRARATAVGRLTQSLEGTSFGVDFNPAANALRIISDTGQNLRHPFAGPTAGQTQRDTVLTAGGVTSPGVTGAAYTNNDLDPRTATTLYDLDTATDQIVIQSPANSGMLVPTGALGVDAGADAGFDIYSELRAGRTVAVTGFAAVNSSAGSELYLVNLITGELSRVGSFRVPVNDIAIQLDQS
jgi:hypothetical protein